MMKVSAGEKWARVQCLRVDVRSEPEYAFDTRGGKYETGVFSSESFYQFKCECGKEFELAADQFHGKRRLKDCGCGLGESDVAVFVGVTMPLKLRRILNQYAVEHGVGMSHATVRLIEAGLRGVGVDQVKREVEDAKG